MSKANIENMIPHAVKILHEKFGDKIPSVYQGYISSYGVGIVQTGLKPTLAFFSKKKGEGEHNTQEDLSLVNTMVAELLHQSGTIADGAVVQETLLTYVIGHPAEEASLTEQIKDASVALKLAMRIFELDKGGA